MAASTDSLIQTLPTESLRPLDVFPSQNLFVSRHEQGTLIEMENEITVLKKFNERRQPFKSWPIAPIPGLANSFVKPWLFLVLPSATGGEISFPTVTDRFTIDMEATVERAEGKFSLVHLAATRIPNPYENLEGPAFSSIQKLAAFQVDVYRSRQNDDGMSVELDLMTEFQTASAIDSVVGSSLNEANAQYITIQWDASSLTFEAELAALRFLTEQKRLASRGPSPKSLRAFETILDFNKIWKSFYDLHSEFPHLENPFLAIHRIPQLLLNKFRGFNDHHLAAYNGLKMIPNGLYFVNGCPGAGKTEWNMVLAALIQSKRRPSSKRRRNPILFLVDINKTVDDAADRYFNLCKAAGLKLRVIRMHGWPYEMRHSDRINKTEGQAQTGGGDGDTELDFTKKFMTAANLAQHTTMQRNPNKAPTLDEAAWDYYATHQDDCFSSLKKILSRMEVGEALGAEDWKLLRSLVSLLYRAVLAQTDFIATTPVAAHGSFSRLFQPDVIFVDEAPHARELTTLIPIAFYSPVAWIFTGDVNQTEPFVKSGNRKDAMADGVKWNPYAEQLRYSTMARAAAVGALNSKLLVNNRAHGNLHRLPSKMFYQERMSSRYATQVMYPPSTAHLKKHLESLVNIVQVDENRVIIRLKDSQEEQRSKSYWNPVHHKWLMGQVQTLLKDDKFESLTGQHLPGTIMIATPYRSAFSQYQIEVKKWPQEWQDRVEVLTVDKAQGNQADLVFLDMVRTSGAGFMDDPKRLNVAITRARQAEIILMHYQMTWRGNIARRVRSQYTSQLWDDAVSQGRVFTL